MPFVEMVKMFEDLSYLYRQKLSSPDGQQMKKIHLPKFKIYWYLGVSLKRRPLKRRP